MDDTPRRLCWHGALLFLLGLATGLFVMKLENPRMGLAAHVEGVMNGILLLALGSAWTRLALGAALYGAYANRAAELGREAGANALHLETEEENEGADRLYARLGFRSYGRRLRTLLLAPIPGPKP